MSRDTCQRWTQHCWLFGVRLQERGWGGDRARRGGSKGTEREGEGKEDRKVRGRSAQLFSHTHTAPCRHPRSSLPGLWAAWVQAAAAVAVGSRGGFVGAEVQAGTHQWGLGWAWSHHPHLLWWAAGVAWGEKAWGGKWGCWREPGACIEHLPPSPTPAPRSQASSPSGA